MKDLALVLSGGGARAAYQVGFLHHIASRHPDLMPGILTGVSAGGLLATHLAARPGPFGESVERLTNIWRDLRMDDVFHTGPIDLGWQVARWGLRLISGGVPGSPRTRGLVDTRPLHRLLMRTLDPAPDRTLPGIRRNLGLGHLHAVALTASSYTTGQSVTWVENNEGCGVLTMAGVRHEDSHSRLRIDHAMASASLPFFFPAIEVDGAWYGDGGIGLTAPLAPAVRLGAGRIMVVSTRHGQSPDDVRQPRVSRYPPPAQVGGVLFNAIFLDQLDADVTRLERVNALIDPLPVERRGGLRHVDMLILRPSRDLGVLANAFEPDLPRGFRFLVRGLGSRETRANDMISLLMFQPDYIAALLELGESDAHARADEIDAFLVRRSD